jgi:hypothetical protein
VSPEELERRIIELLDRVILKREGATGIPSR